MKTPLEIYGRLFVDLQMAKVAPDDKAISDAIPLQPIDKILAEYNSKKDSGTFDAHTFFKMYFKVVKAGDSGFKSDTSQSVTHQINRLWAVLERKNDLSDEGSSLIDLKHPYIVPGGRFNEIYYWDSYFTMLGLKVSNRQDVILSMVDNFADMIDQFGFIPNGNRSYFLTRSQPPFFALMVELLASIQGEKIICRYLTQLLKEYDFWMKRPSNASEQFYKRTVRVEKELYLNRYYDEGSEPRQEMYATDVEMCKDSNRQPTQLMADIRAACESGWDFSSRWLTNPGSLSSIHTSDILPVDLNCLLYQLELTIAKGHRLNGSLEQADLMLEKALQRKELIQSYFWNDDFYYDYTVGQGKPTEVLSLAGIFPLVFNIANEDQALKCAQKIEEAFLKPGGVVTSLEVTGQQWDAPNGWAPLQYMTIVGLQNYGFSALANTIKSRWLALNERVFKQTGKMLEKYNVVDIDLPTGGGEYPVQDGFGWTNGVYLALKNK